MSGLALLGVIAALVLPFLVAGWYRRSTRTIYDGTATLINIGILGNTTRDREYDYVHVEVPGHGALLMRVRKDRISACNGCTTELVVTVKQAPFGKPHIATAIWPGETSVETIEEGSAQLWMPLWYLMLGMGSLVLFAAPAGTQSALMQHASLYGSMLILALSGFMFGWLSKHKLDNIGEARSTMFGFIPLGRGITGLATMTAVCIALNLAIFWTPSILLLLGLNTAFVMGGCAALLLKVTRRQRTA